MATSISGADLTVSIIEKITFNGRDEGGTTTVTRSTTNQIKDLFRRVIAVKGTAETVLFTTDATLTAGSKFDYNNIQYLRITNKDAANSVDLIIANGDDDEVGYLLNAGESLVLWGTDGVLDAINTADTVTVTVFTAAAGDVAVADGDAAHGLTNGQYLQLISTDGTTKNYVVSDTNAGGVATGTVLASDTDIGSNTFGNLVSAVEAGVAVGIDGSAPTQNDFLVALKAAIEHANGHNGKITVGSVPTEANGAQSITITQATKGTAGNTTTTEDLATVTSASFTGGLAGAVTNKSYIKSINAIAAGDDIDVEVLIASKA